MEELSDVVGTSKQYYSHGEKVKFKCQAGYILDSGSEKTCWDGKWYHPIRCSKYIDPAYEYAWIAVVQCRNVENVAM